MKEKKFSLYFYIFLILFFLIWGLRATVFYFADLEIESASLKNIYSNFIKFAFWVVPAVLYIVYIDKANALSELKLNTPFKKRKLIYAALWIIAFFAGVIVVEFFATGRTLVSLFHSNLSTLSSVFLSIFLSPIAEEILFRGFILNKFSENKSFAVSNLLTSLLFVLIHLPHWIWANGFQGWIITTSVSIFILSLFLGYLVKVTNSLYPSIIAHILNNFLANFFRN